MKGKRNLGLIVMTLAMAFALAFSFSVKAAAADSKSDNTGVRPVNHEFYNKLSTGNGKMAQVVKYRVTKKASAFNKDDESKDGECIVIGCEGDAEKIVIQARPRDEDGTYYKTVGIADGCFAGNKELEYVQFNDSKITDIPTKCFYGCSNLKTVLIQDSDLKTIGAKAFYNCKNLKKLTILSNKINAKSRIKSNAFKNVKNVKVLANSTSRAKKYAKWIKARGAKKTTYGEADD